VAAGRTVEEAAVGQVAEVADTRVEHMVVAVDMTAAVDEQSVVEAADTVEAGRAEHLEVVEVARHSWEKRLVGVLRKVPSVLDRLVEEVLPGNCHDAEILTMAAMAGELDSSFAIGSAGVAGVVVDCKDPPSSRQRPCQ
jgi:hypothetical protein